MSVGIFVIFLSGVALCVLGYWYLTVPLDVLWRQHERRLLMNGLAPVRNAIWEQRARSGAWPCIGVGVMIMAFAVFMSVGISSSQKKSGVFINGRELTQAEWDDCGRDEGSCMMAEVMREQKKSARQNR